MTEASGRIRVLTVIDSLGVGGAESLLPTYLKHLDQDRFEPLVVALRRGPANHLQQLVAARAAGLRQWESRGLLKIGRIDELARAIRSWRVDLVHTHLLYANIQGTLGARRARVPSVATLHSQYPSRHQLRSIPKRTVETAVLRASRTPVIAVAERVRDAYSGVLGLPASQMRVIANAVDLDRFQEQSSDVARATREALLAGASGPLVVAVGRMAEPKGFPDFVRAAAIARAELPSARFAIAGRAGGDTALVEAEIERLQLGDTVLLLGERDDIPALLTGADLYVMSSHWEGSPVALLEAMAAGVPVVATSVGDVPALVEDGVNGLLVEPRRPEELARAMVRLLSAPQTAAEVAARARATAHRFDAETWVRQLEAVYDDALGAACRQLAQ